MSEPSELDEQIRVLAASNGCRPVWSEGMESYYCGCEDELHFGDQQSSLITLRSAARQRPGSPRSKFRVVP